MNSQTRPEGRTAVRNEAAERLRVHLAEGTPYFAGGTLDQWLDDALAAERRATVEQIRERLLGDSSPVDALYERHTRAILDEALATPSDKATR